MPSTVCLNMIVKNEARVIRRCLESLRPHIDHWVIVDTGSTDGTQSVIRTLLEDIPGELHERPWKNFGHNRTEAIRLAEDKADYLLLCDADMTFQANDRDWKSNLTHDAYLVRQVHAGSAYRNVRLINARLTGDQRWRYWGSTHEYVDAVRPSVGVDKGQTDAIEFIDHADGGSKAEKFTRDAALLEHDLRTIEDLERRADKSPNDAKLREELGEKTLLHTRTIFYLAQTYRDMGEFNRSLGLYRRRAAMGGWEEEVWYSLFEVAKLSERLKLDSALVAQRYLDAYDNRPRRAEPLVELARWFRERKQFALARLFADRAVKIPRPDDILFLDAATYDWRALDEFAVASYWVEQYQDCANACETLLSGGKVPFEHLARVHGNLNFALTKLGRPLAPIRSAIDLRNSFDT